MRHWQNLMLFDQGMIIAARKMECSISNMATALGFSLTAVASIYQKHMNSEQT